MRLPSRLANPTAGYFTSTTASAVRSVHNSASRQARSTSQHSLQCRHNSNSVCPQRDCCNIKKVQFDLSKNVVPAPPLQPLNQTKKSNSKTSPAGPVTLHQKLKPSGTGSYFRPKSKPSASLRNFNGSAVLASSQSIPRMQEDRPRQLASSPSAKKSQTLFFKKQV